MSEYFCTAHQTEWFKGGKMKNYAHPIKDVDGNDTGKWCNMPKEALEDEHIVEEAKNQGATVVSETSRDTLIHRQVAAKCATTQLQHQEFVNVGDWGKKFVAVANKVMKYIETGE